MSVSLSRLWNASLQTVWPAACAACDRSIPDEALFCAACNLSINPLCGACQGCALPIGDLFAAVDRTSRCRTCRRVPFPFINATAGFEYGEALAEALVRMKHGGRRFLARRLARLLVEPLAGALARGRVGRGDAVVAVPLHAHKLGAARLQPGAGAGPLGAGRPVARARPGVAGRPSTPRASSAPPGAADARAGARRASRAAGRGGRCFSGQRHRANPPPARPSRRRCLHHRRDLQRVRRRPPARRRRRGPRAGPGPGGLTTP